MATPLQHRNSKRNSYFEKLPARYIKYLRAHPNGEPFQAVPDDEEHAYAFFVLSFDLPGFNQSMVSKYMQKGYKPIEFVCPKGSYRKDAGHDDEAVAITLEAVIANNRAAYLAALKDYTPETKEIDNPSLTAAEQAEKAKLDNDIILEAQARKDAKSRETSSGADTEAEG